MILTSTLQTEDKLKSVKKKKKKVSKVQTLLSLSSKWNFKKKPGQRVLWAAWGIQAHTQWGNV